MKNKIFSMNKVLCSMFHVSSFGFTLIELLIVIAIISSLSAILVPNFMAVREKSRDTQRKNDLTQMQRALELYKQDQNPIQYPLASPAPNQQWSNSSTGTVYMKKVPFDPNSLTPTPYCYTQNTLDTLKYTLCAVLENKADADGQSCSSCSDYCSSGTKCFVVTE